VLDPSRPGPGIAAATPRPRRAHRSAARTASCHRRCRPHHVAVPPEGVPITTTIITTTTTQGSDYAVLMRRVRDAGLLERRRGRYAVKIAGTLAVFFAGWAVFFRLGESWYQLLVAAGMAVAFTQVSFLGHDAGHRQIFATRRANALFGLLVGNLLVGFSYGWWVDKHNRHHAHPNEEGADPDVSDGALAFSAGQALERRSAFGRWFARTQAWLFFPLLTLEGLNLHVASVRTLLGGPRRRYRRAEIALLGTHLVAYPALLLTVLPPLHALAFLAVHQGVFGVYLGCSFAPNHKGMPMLSAADERDFLRRQVLTSRNVRGGRFTDVLLGGLNYQTEHHLFPSVPRQNLRRLQPLVRAHCADLRLPYTETGLVVSYAIVLRHLHAVGAPLRTAR
jgi:fatty acid desaturase